MSEKIEQLIQQMTLEEKVSLLAGADMWHSVPVERLGVPVFKVTDGPNGARGAAGSAGPTSACTPCGAALAATWNTELVERVGKLLAEEVKAKGAHILLAPTVNIHRSPVAGRNFECYSEDPFQSGTIASAYIDGLQKNGVGACIKHFVANDQEFERNSISSEVAERPLHEIYLEPFRIAIEKAKPWAVMSAYNRINGVYAADNDDTLYQILKERWGFDGIVMSDWFGTYSPAAAESGLDLEMPGPARWTKLEHVQKALAAGRMTEEKLNDKVRRMLRTLERAGAFENPELQPEQNSNNPAQRAILRRASAESIVLLKNDGSLPLQNTESILILGENAVFAQIVGGGSAHVNVLYLVTPLDGIKARAKGPVRYAIGTPTHRNLPGAQAAWLQSENGSAGLTLRAYTNPDLAGAAYLTEDCARFNFSWFNTETIVPNPEAFSVKLSGTLTVPESGSYDFGLGSLGLSRLFLDGELLLDQWTGRTDKEMREKMAAKELEAGRKYNILIEYSFQGKEMWRGLRFGLMASLPADPIAEAVQLAAKADVVVLVAGLTNEWESEGFDRPDMDLPLKQDELIRRVAAANPKTVVVVNAGSPVSMPWADEVAAILQYWLPGQEGGNALADVLFGDVNPSGKLPSTHPLRYQDSPAYINFPGENGKVFYGEGIFVGYRYYEKREMAVRFPFGFGLSYTTFAYSNLKLDKDSYGPQDQIQVSVTIQNTGKRAGQEVVQLYIRDEEARLVRPQKELKGFAKVALAAGECKTITLTLDRQSLAFYDPSIAGWVAEAGRFEVLVGASSADIRLRAAFDYRGDPIPAAGRTFDLDSQLKDIFADPQAKAVLEKHLPEMLGAPELQMAMGMSLNQIAPFASEVLTADRLKAIETDLKG
ncbi:MAG: glycoside hydrolase family 3 C-terminal domain-containing protein [Anaerolineales bacterium]|jgi:beta-glucosidase|nr:glycoside hydrolase family 3 C-terminal domain-containing protein [Anaerolineales bacterium]